jgi:hypothetical protein
MWYVRGTKVDVKINGDWRPWTWSQKEYALTPRWKAAPTASYEAGLTPASTVTDGTAQVTLRASRPLWLRGIYTPTGCGLPNVTSQYLWDWDTSQSSGLCPDSEVDPDQGVHLTAPVRGSRLPVWTMSWPSYPHGNVGTAARHGGKGTTYVGQSLRYAEYHTRVAHTARVGMTYCTPFNVTVEPVQVNGQPMPQSGLDLLASSDQPWTGDPLSYLEDEGGCPASLMGFDNTSQRVGLTDAANQKWVRVSATFNGRSLADGTNPTLSVDANGTTSGAAKFKLTPRCFEVQWSDWVDVDTAPNCPGYGPGRWFLAGTAVAVTYDGDNDREFEHWEGVDSSEGGNAVVIMNANRKPIAHWDNLSIWEQAGNFFSSLGQRALAALTTAAMAVAGKVLLVGTVASLLMGGIATGLEAIGAKGAVADGFRQGSEAVDSAVDLAVETSNCVSLWATGGASPLIPSPVGQANSAVGGAAAVGGKVAGNVSLGALGSGREASQTVGGVTKKVGAAINVVNAFGAGTDAYFADARDAWSSIGHIGSCLAPAVDRVAAAG